MELFVIAVLAVVAWAAMQRDVESAAEAFIMGGVFILLALMYNIAPEFRAF